MTTISLVIAVISTIISIIGTLGTFMYWQYQKLDSDIKNVANSLDGWTKHLTAIQAEQSKRIDKMHERTDQVYNLILDMLKKGK